VTPSLILVRSFAKVNLALAVFGKRPDGYHEVRTVIQAIDLCDELELRPAAKLSFHCEALDSLPPEQNLIWKSALALSRAAGVSFGAEIQLRKRIPVGAGLGGGSSNAAAALLGLCRLWRLQIPAQELHRIAADLGSDVPFFLHGGVALAAGRGTDVHSLPDLPVALLVVIFPGIHISTRDAYRKLSLGLTFNDGIHKIEGFCGQMQTGLGCLTGIFNDFETSILPAYPAIRETKEFLQRWGAIATLLSGSGSAVFGFFLDEESALAASRATQRESWRVFPAKTLSRAEYFHRIFG
jgi:4-diphosphocytidyl-2-C-methyl-D-erythritol kinase